jgi:hypothetical protein
LGSPFWLAQQDNFPTTPWLTLKEETIGKIRKKRTEIQEEETQINAGRHKFIKPPPGYKISLPVKLPSAPVETIEWMCAALRGSNVNLRQSISYRHVWYGDTEAVRAWFERLSKAFTFSPECEIKPAPETSSFEIQIPWRLSDSEILAHIKTIIEWHRPKQFKEYAKAKPLLQLDVHDVLPFRKDAALQWLGVLRRRNSVNTWREYFKLYETRNFDRGSERAREEDCRKAKLILNWFDNGTPLKKERFK